MSSKKLITSIGKDITYTSMSEMPTGLKKVGFCIINTYEGTRISLGEGPMNDGYNMAKCLKRFGYDVYYVLNAKSKNFKQKFAYFLSQTVDELVVYYVGHGTNVRDLDGDEADGYDEAIVFVDGNVIDDELIEIIIKNKNAKNKTCLVSDCCHSGSIWDIQSGNYRNRVLPENLISLSASNDKQTAKQTVVERKEQGMFTYYMNKLLKTEPKLTPVQLKNKLTTTLRRYQQTVTIATTSAELLTQPTF